MCKAGASSNHGDHTASLSWSLLGHVPLFFILRPTSSTHHDPCLIYLCCGLQAKCPSSWSSWCVVLLCCSKPVRLTAGLWFCGVCVLVRQPLFHPPGSDGRVIPSSEGWFLINSSHVFATLPAATDKHGQRAGFFSVVGNLLSPIHTNKKWCHLQSFTGCHWDKYNQAESVAVESPHLGQITTHTEIYS